MIVLILIYNHYVRYILGHEYPGSVLDGLKGIGTTPGQQHTTTQVGNYNPPHTAADAGLPARANFLRFARIK